MQSINGDFPTLTSRVTQVLYVLYKSTSSGILCINMKRRARHGKVEASSKISAANGERERSKVNPLLHK